MTKLNWRIGHIALRRNKAEDDAAQRRRTPEERCEKEGSLVIDPQGEQGRKKGGARKKSTKSYRAFQPACKYSSQEEAEEKSRISAIASAEQNEKDSEEPSEKSGDGPTGENQLSNNKSE